MSYTYLSALLKDNKIPFQIDVPSCSAVYLELKASRKMNANFV